jgi:hypothetical protein
MLSHNLRFHPPTPNTVPVSCIALQKIYLKKLCIVCSLKRPRKKVIQVKKKVRLKTEIRMLPAE